MELIEIANTLIEKIEREYKDDVALMCLYGSYVFNETHEKSDLDFYYIPKTERGFELAKTFIVDDIGFDFWPITWERAEKIANFEEETVSLIANAKIVYCNNNEDLKRFELLREKAKNPRIDLTNKTEEMIGRCKSMLEEIILAENITERRARTVRFVKLVVLALHIANKKYVRKGSGDSIYACADLATCPNDIVKKLSNILFEDDIKKLTSMSKMLLNEIISLVKGNNACDVNIAHALGGFYEEAKSLYNKVYNACDTGDGITAYMNISLLQEDLMYCLTDPVYFRYFSNLIEGFEAKDLAKFKKIVEDHEECFKKLIKKNGLK